MSKHMADETVRFWGVAWKLGLYSIHYWNASQFLRETVESSRKGYSKWTATCQRARGI